MIDLDKAVSDFKQIFTLKGSFRVVKLMEDVYKGKLMILQILRCNNGRLFAGELAEKLGVSTARVATAIKGLESKGHVVRKQATEDGRKVVISITDQGESVLDEHIRMADNILKERLKKLEDHEVEMFIRLAAKLFALD